MPTGASAGCASQVVTEYTTANTLDAVNESPLMPEQDEFLSFLDEEERSPALPVGVTERSWRVLIADDDLDVHTTTEFALGDAIGL
jgi:hypothetical protein